MFWLARLETERAQRSNVVLSTDCSILSHIRPAPSTSIVANGWFNGRLNIWRDAGSMAGGPVAACQFQP